MSFIWTSRPRQPRSPATPTGAPPTVLIHERTRIADDAVIPLGVEPRHREGRSRARTATHRNAPIRVVRELDVVMSFDLRQDFMLDELSVSA
jgi:hypothetical protein